MLGEAPEALKLPALEQACGLLLSSRVSGLHLTLNSYLSIYPHIHIYIYNIILYNTCVHRPCEIVSLQPESSKAVTPNVEYIYVQYFLLRLLKHFGVR